MSPGGGRVHGTMQVLVNGETREVPEGCTVAALLEALQIGGRFAVELNEEILPRSLYAERRLAAGDRVEVVRAIGGGAG